MRHLILLVLVATAFSQAPSAGGYDQVVIAANHDPDSCLLHLDAHLYPDHIHIREDVYNPFNDCSIWNLQFVSMFDNSILGNLTMKPTPNELVYDANLTLDLVTQYNGTACVQIYPGAGDNVYICRFKFGEALLHLWFKADEQTNEIRTNWTGLWFPLAFHTILVPQNFTNVWKASNSQNANIVGKLYQSCDSWSTSISNKNQNVFINGTIYSSQGMNLGQLLNGMLLYSSVVHPRGTNASNYVTQWTDSHPFNANQIGACTNLGFTYDAIQPKIADCKGNGCDVTFILLGNQTIYTLQTSGFTYSGALRG